MGCHCQHCCLLYHLICLGHFVLSNEDHFGPIGYTRSLHFTPISPPYSYQSTSLLPAHLTPTSPPHSYQSTSLLPVHLTPTSPPYSYQSTSLLPVHLTPTSPPHSYQSTLLLPVRTCHLIPAFSPCFLVKCVHTSGDVCTYVRYRYEHALKYTIPMWMSLYLYTHHTTFCEYVL